MPIVAILPAIAAIGIAAATASTFAIIVAVGSTAAAVGAVTKVKELTIAGLLMVARLPAARAWADIPLRVPSWH